MARTRQQQIGDAWEVQVAKDTGGERQPNSGAGSFYKLDVEGTVFLISAKATEFKTYPLGAEEVEEIEHALVAPGGLGVSVLPIVALRVRGAELAVIRWADFLEMAREDTVLFRPSRHEAKRRRAATPQLLREPEDG